MSEQADQQEGIVDLEQAADLLKTSKPTLYRWLARGKLQGFKAGRQWRFYRRDLTEFLERDEPLTPRLAPEEADRLIATLDHRLTSLATQARRAREGGLPMEADRRDEKEPTGEGQTTGEAADAERLRQISSSEPLKRVTDVIIANAIEDRASDIHIDPARDQLTVRYRVDGVLHDIMQMPPYLHDSLIPYIKIRAGMNTTERRVPQDGRMAVRTVLNAAEQHRPEVGPTPPPADATFQSESREVLISVRVEEVAGRAFDLRVASYPTIFGEKLVARILDPGSALPGLERLGLHEHDLTRVRAAVRQPCGLVIVTGPTGSGKTTTLYGCLRELVSPEINIVTIEDPVERTFPGLQQASVNRKAGFTFASALRSMLRLDPDVIYVGEIRDLETAELTVQAALTGHLVMTTLHANDASLALTRLVDVGLEPLMVGQGLICVVAQRLARVVCAECAQPAETVPSVLAQAREEAKAGGYELPASAQFRTGPGCQTCRKTGCRGRTGLYEVLTMSDRIKQQIIERAPAAQIRQTAVAEGMTTLLADGVCKAVEGITSLEEVLRVTMTARS